MNTKKANPIKILKDLLLSESDKEKNENLISNI